MSTNKQSAGQDPEFDFWDFVSCAVCHIPFSPPDRGPPPVPFWITECGHVLCNSHLNPNQTCTKCGDEGIQLMPLQRNIDPPMSDWFRFLPYALDGMANAVKFQQESLSALVRHYRNQCLQLSATCDRLRNERRSLRKDVEALRKDLHLCRNRGFIAGGEPSTHLNQNGKRPIGEVRGQNNSIKSNSSPRSIPTPIGPLRLTLPPGEHPGFSRQDPSGQEFANIDKPGSSRFAEQYAYRGEDNLRVQARPPNERQSTSTGQPGSHDVSHGIMAPPPPVQGKQFKPATGQVYLHADQMDYSTAQNLERMGPPPTPQRPFSASLRTPVRGPMQNATLQSSLPTNRFIPSSSHGRVLNRPPTMTPGGKIGQATRGNHMPFTPQNSTGFG